MQDSSQAWPGPEKDFRLQVRENARRLLVACLPPMRRLDEALARTRWQLESETATLRSRISSLTTDFQGQISSLQAQISSLTGENAALKAQISSLTAENATLKARTASLKAEGAALKSENSSLASRAASLDAEVKALQAGQELWTPQHIGFPPLLFTPPPLNEDQQDLVDRFHNFMYEVTDKNSFRSYFVSWLGYGTLKWPTDLWNYQEIVTQTKPDVIIETGTHRGGTSLFLATICDLIGHGQIVTVDLDESFRSTVPRHPRITYLNGSSTDPLIVNEIAAIVGKRNNVLVILDSDHHCKHVLEELRAYSKFVPHGGHLIVEDTNINGHPASPDFGPGPWEAVEAFLAENPDFSIDRNHERFYWTQNPKGFLRRLPQ